MNHQRPYAVSIAGFDPSAGAGLLSDIKTMEANAVYGLGIMTALTYQNDIFFERLEWTDPEKIMHQLLVLHSRFSLRYIKIGLIENFTVLLHLVGMLRFHMPGVVIVWDPVLKASSGFFIHDQPDYHLFHDLLPLITCLTPNRPEAQLLFGTDNLHECLLEQSRHAAIFLKGGHEEDKPLSTDLLYYGQQVYAYSNRRLLKGEKHGSGCVLSSALTAGLALGMDMPAAARHANTYTHQFLASNETLLGYHSYISDNHEKNK